MGRPVKHQPSPGKQIRPRPKPTADGDSAFPRGARQHERWRTVVTCLLLTLAVWVVFGQTLQHEFVNCDDDVYVTDNPHVSAGWTWNGVGWAFSNLQAGFWHPLTWLSFMTDAQFHGLRARGFHLTNVLLHLANTLLLFLLLRKLTNAHWGSAFVAAVFAVHPLHVESVAWVSERKGLLSTSFFLLSLWAYAKCMKSGEWQVTGNAWRLVSLVTRLSSSFYWGALFFFACGLMSKTMVVTLPLVMLLLDYWPLRRFEPSTLNAMARRNEAETTQPSTILRLVLEKVPFLALALAAGWLTYHAEKSIGALSHGDAIPLTHRLANAGLSAVWYLWRTIWPAELAVFYPYTGSFSTAWVVGSLLLLVAISLLALWLGRRHPYLVVGWFWYLVTLSPVSGLIQVGAHARADRYTYVPALGIFLIVGWGLGELCGHWRHRRALLVVASAICFRNSESSCISSM